MKGTKHAVYSNLGEVEVTKTGIAHHGCIFETPMELASFIGELREAGERAFGSEMVEFGSRGIKRYKDQILDETEPDCKHEFFKCQVPAGDSCQPIYHQVCRLCHWDETKGCIMPDEVWNGWAISCQ